MIDNLCRDNFHWGFPSDPAGEVTDPIAGIKDLILRQREGCMKGREGNVGGRGRVEKRGERTHVYILS